MWANATYSVPDNVKRKDATAAAGKSWSFALQVSLPGVQEYMSSDPSKARYSALPSSFSAPACPLTDGSEEYVERAESVK